MAKRCEIPIEVIEKAIKKYGSQVQAAKELGISRDTVHRMLNRPQEKKQSPLLERVSDIFYMDKKEPKDMSFEEVVDGYLQAQGFRGGFSIKQLETTAVIKSKRPIALSCLSDLHFGSPNTNYEAILEDAQTIKATKDMFVLLGGDIADKMNTFRIADVAGGQLHPVTIQILTEEKFIDFLGDKIVAKIGGNHDRMDSKKSGVDSNYFVHRHKKYPYLPHGGLLKIILNGIEYRILWKHQYRFKSSLNQFNSHHRMWEILDPTADIVVQEHEHNPGIESLERGEYEKKTVVNIRTGAYKIDDGFSMDFYKSGRIAPQTVILFPDKKKILAMHGRDAIKDAQTYLRGYHAKT